MLLKRLSQLFVLVVVTCILGCSTDSTNTQSVTGDFWGKGDDADLPYSWESVCVDAIQNAETDKCGDTHFGMDGSSVAVSFQRFETPEMAVDWLHGRAKESVRVLRIGVITDKENRVVGEKMILVSRSKLSEVKEEYYSLLWTRGARFAGVYSDSLDAVEKYEKDRSL